MYAKLACLLLLALTLTGCSNAQYQRTWGTNGRDFDVKVYSGPALVAEYATTGKVQSEDHSDGWYFVDAKTGQIVIVSGTLIITPK